MPTQRVAEDTGLAAAGLHKIVREQGGANAETAIVPGAYFGWSPEFWMNAQMTYEISKELIENDRNIRTRMRPTPGSMPACLSVSAGGWPSIRFR